LETLKLNTDCNEIGFLELKFVGFEVSIGNLKHVKKGSLNFSFETHLDTMQAPLSEIFQVISGIEELKIHRSATHVSKFTLSSN
jgi:hypothetical protein